MINKFSILNGARYFSSGIFKNYLVFIPAKKCIKYFSGTTRTDSWKSNGMSEENTENITTLVTESFGGESFGEESFGHIFKISVN